MYIFSYFFLHISDCGTAVTVANAGKSTTTTTYNTYVYYTCNTGYNVGGSPNYVYCQSNGVWTSTSYSCTVNGREVSLSCLIFKYA